VAATAATQSVENPNTASGDQKARSISDTKATLKHQQNVLKLQQLQQQLAQQPLVRTCFYAKQTLRH
jgi:hypothetical protein